MAKTTYAVKISTDLREKVKEFCEEHGYKQGAFVEKALREKLEEEEDRQDIFDLRSLRRQEGKAVPLEAYLRSRRRA